MKCKQLIGAVAGLCLMGSANASLLHFDGEIDYHNDLIFISFSLDQYTEDVRVWTDSYEGGINFDPITALWRADGTLIQENDDDGSIDPATQTIFDSGFNLSSLDAGDYVFSVATYNNFANGTTLSQGFDFDDENPIALELWDQPASSTNMGHYWSVWLDGVDSATGPVPPSQIPEPASYLLMLLGVFGLVARSKLK